MLNSGRNRGPIEALFSLLSVAFSLLLFYFVCVLILRDNQAAVARDIDLYSRYFISGSWKLLPEAKERTCYFTGLLILPSAAISFYLLFEWLRNKYDRLFLFAVNDKFCVLRDAVVAAAIFIWGCLILSSAVREAGAGHLVVHLGPAAVSAAILLTLALWAVRQRKLVTGGKQLVLWLGIFLIMIMSLVQLVPEDTFLNSGELVANLSMMIGPAVQVLHGKTMLVNVTSQYGVLYPHFEEIFFRLAGLSVFKLSLFWAALVFCTWTFIFLALREKMGRSSWFPLVSLLMIFGLFYAGTDNFYLDFSPYFQYLPLRMIFPAFFIWYLPVYLRAETKIKYLLGFVLAALAALWNFDSGAVLLVAWTGFLVYDTLAVPEQPAARKVLASLGHLAAAVLSLLAAAAVYSGFALLRAHHLPYWQKLFEFQFIFYKYGYYMLPMRPVDLWQVPGLIYFAVIFCCLRRLAARAANNWTRYYFFLALLGGGLFSYYQGRSGLGSLFFVSYPCLVLVSCLLYDFASSCRPAIRDIKTLLKNNIFRLAAIICFPLLAIYCYGVINFFALLPGIDNYLVHKVFFPQAAPAGLKRAMSEAAAHIKNGADGDKALVLSDVAEYLHLKTNTCSPLPFSSLSEVFLLRQLGEIQQYIDQARPAKIFILPSNYMLGSWVIYKAQFLGFKGYDGRRFELGPLSLLELSRR